MPNLEFRVEGASVVPNAASPLLALALEIVNTGAEPIHTVVLRCQIQIEAARRHYNGDDQSRLLDLFGEPDRWSQTLRSMLWTHTQLVVPSFSGRTVAQLQVPCTFDFNVAATKYFHAVSDGEVPLFLLFSGSVFYEGADGLLQVAPISWDKEARFRLPVSLWRDMMEAYYPNTAWLCLRKDAFERLYQFKMLHGIPTWEEALETLVRNAEEVVPV
jgi:Family of unknown function (DUF6084)